LKTVKDLLKEFHSTQKRLPEYVNNW